MMKFICLFLPAVLGTVVYLKLQTKKKETLSIILYYFGNVLWTTFFSLLISYFAFHVNSDIENLLTVSVPFAIKYLSVSIIISILWTMIYTVVEKNMNVKLVVKKNEKKK